jgi:flagellar basal-body rod protein FlgG
MFEALAIGATGMQAQQAHVDAIANNLANVNTAAFKKNRTSFSELVVASMPSGRDAAGAGLFAAGGVGAGVQLAARGKVFDAGEARRTEAPLDLAIVGDGFLELAMPDGTRAYARGGSLKVSADGQLGTQAGVPLKPGLAIPDNAESVTISATGRVQVRLPGQSTAVEVGQLELVRFANPQGLAAQGANLYRATDASGEPIGGRPGEEGLGTIVQGALESSNVKMVEEMVDLMVAQRAYEASVKVVQAADDMLGMINGLRR